MKLVSKVTLALCAFGLATGVTLADEYPTRPIRIVVPYAAGGPSDTGTRLLATPLSKQLGISVVIENRGGGGGLNATEQYLKAEQDGYTILVGAIGPLTIIPNLKPVSYDVDKDVVPLGSVWSSAQVLAVRPSLGVKTVAEFVAYAKAHPNQVTIGSAGVGAVTHLAIELLKKEAGIQLVHIPFRSTSESMPQLIGGQIDALFGDASIIASQVHSGKMTALAVAGNQRAPALPEVTTMAEAGYPAVECESWFGLVVSSKTPPQIIKRLQDAVFAAQKQPDYLASLAKQRASGGAPGAEAFGKVIKNDEVKWKRVIAAAGIKLQ
jgi:tripartite-type tricarboxylate transporter receptor subunit TctC